MPTTYLTLIRLGAIGLISWLAWSNWTLRSQLHDLAQQQQSLEQRLQVSQNLANQALARPPQPECPIVQAQQTTGSIRGRPLPTNPPTVQNDTSLPVTGTPTIQIPPGTDLREALQIIQREQTKNQTGSAGFNPFGSTK